MNTWFLTLAATALGATLPSGNLILGYAPQCSETKITADALQGVNVVIWFAINLAYNSTTDRADIQFGIDPECIARVALALRDLELPTTHLVSIGGWDAPHPSTHYSGVEWWALWRDWNNHVIARPELGFFGFDGIDWDLEGNDDPESSDNLFTPDCMALVGTMSQAAKANGFIVTLVPPQSYFDPTVAAFDLSLLHTYPEYHPTFAYHGFNAYALWWSKYGGAATFDLVDVQLYETWSRASEAIDGNHVAPADYLVAWAQAITTGWRVNFNATPEVEWPSSFVQVPPQNLAVGFSFGSSDNSARSVFIDPSAVGEAFARMPNSTRPRAVMFWNMNMDGMHANGTQTPCNMVGNAT